MTTRPLPDEAAAAVFPIGSSGGTAMPLGTGVTCRYPDHTDVYGTRRAHYAQRVLTWALRNPSCIVSHLSAAALHGLPADAAALSTIHAIFPHGSGNRRSRKVWRHVGRLADDEILQVGPVRLTTLARSLIDVARCEEPWRAVAIADAALHREVVSVPELRSALGRIVGQPGSVRIADTLALTDGRAESVGESRMRVCLRHEGLDRLEFQFDVYDKTGVFIGRVDAGDPRRGVAVEFDGDVKYTALLRPGETAADVKLRQDQREARLRSAGFIVIRVAWADLEDPAALAQKVRDALVEGERNRRAGRITAQCGLKNATGRVLPACK